MKKRSKPLSGAWVLGLFFFTVVVPILLKTSGHTRLATWSWWRVTSVIWVPLLLSGFLSALGWGLLWLGRRE